MQEDDDEPMVEVKEEPGVQEASATSTPIQIEEVDLLRYRLAGSEHRYAQLRVNACDQELQHAQVGLTNETQKVRKLVATLESKYKFNLQTHSITEDGYLVPRPVPLQQR